MKLLLNLCEQYRSFLVGLLLTKPQAFVFVVFEYKKEQFFFETLLTLRGIRDLWKATLHCNLQGRERERDSNQILPQNEKATGEPNHFSSSVSRLCLALLASFPFLTLSFTS